MQPHQQRVIDEKNELSDKIYKLSSFRTTDMFNSLSEKEQALLTVQLNTMIEYENILEERIQLF
ncbi:hypothetical protein KNT81_gp207 [Proteus phage phiP4-3]|uniref:Uncharacterized protein n=1 Tax=Proteus phage phiP4-3 TaxID=2065203 RepID=A0A2I6PFS5_9CAUD|nr:hypothetical protein KNT81_gp207 [Proteus phage phiP4-3]AUM58564.1 hypothetical protein phiP43_206 [Proteus phage phiP4-3]